MWLVDYPAGCWQLGVEHEEGLEEEEEQRQAGGGCREGKHVAGEQQELEEVRVE